MDEKTFDEVLTEFAKRDTVWGKKIETAHKLEISELKGERAGILKANASLAADNDRLRALVREMVDELSKFHAWEETRALVARAREVIGGNENAHLRAALKPVLECKVMSAMTAEIAPGRSKYCATIIEEAQHIYNEGEENQNEGGAK